MKKVIRTGLIMALVVLSSVSLFGASESYSQAGNFSCGEFRVSQNGTRVNGIPRNAEILNIDIIGVRLAQSTYEGRAQLYVRYNNVSDSAGGSAPVSDATLVSGTQGNYTAPYNPLTNGTILRKQLLSVGNTITLELKTHPDDGEIRTICESGALQVVEGSGISPSDRNNYANGADSAFCCNTNAQCNGWIGLGSSCGGEGYLARGDQLLNYVQFAGCSTAKRCFFSGSPTGNPIDALKSLGDRCNAFKDRCVEGLCMPSSREDISNADFVGENLPGTCQLECRPGDWDCLALRYLFPAESEEITSRVISQQEQIYYPRNTGFFCGGQLGEDLNIGRVRDDVIQYFGAQSGVLGEENALDRFNLNVCLRTEDAICAPEAIGRCTITAPVYSEATKELNISIQSSCLLSGSSYSLEVIQGENVLGTASKDQLNENMNEPIQLTIENFTKNDQKVLIKVTNSAGSIACQSVPLSLTTNTNVINPGVDGRPIDPNRPAQEITPAAGPCNCPGLRSLCIQDGVFNAEALKDDSASSIRSKISDRIDLTAEEKTYAVSCFTCINNGDTWTDTLGCVNTTASGIFSSILRIGLGTIGGIALLRFAGIGYQYAFTKDDAKLKDAVNKVFALFGAILLVLFSVVILRAIGVNLLDVVPPGFFGN